MFLPKPLSLTGLAALFALFAQGACANAPAAAPTPTAVPAAAPTATPEPAAVASPSWTAAAPIWREYLNDRYHVSLWYPADWAQVESSPGFQGADGFVGLTMWGGAPGAATLEQLCDTQAHHPLQPFGTTPEIIALTVSGQPACLIWPAADQPVTANGGPLAEAIMAYPENVVFDGALYQFLILDADPEHIRPLLERLTLILFDSLNTAVPAAPPLPAAATPAPAACAQTHTVQAGERLFSIAAQYGLTWEMLAEANALADPALIYAGQVLCLPAAP